MYTLTINGKRVKTLWRLGEEAEVAAKSIRDAIPNDVVRVAQVATLLPATEQGNPGKRRAGS